MYLHWCKKLDKKVSEFLQDLAHQSSLEINGKSIELSYYHKMLQKHIGLVERRILNDEKIDASEKLYSIFETHTEWISKGKSHKPVELGHNVLIASDQFHFIIHYEVVECQADSNLTIGLGETLVEKYRGQIASISLDKGFYSKENKEALSEIIPMVVMPKKGKRTKEETEEEHSKEFKKLRYAHSAVESNINQLEHNGLNRCLDKGIKNFKRYVALSVLAYNIHQIGKYTTSESKLQNRKLAA